MTSIRRFTCEDLLTFNNVNLDVLTETYNNPFYLTYLAKWPEYCQAGLARVGGWVGKHRVHCKARWAALCPRALQHCSSSMHLRVKSHWPNRPHAPPSRALTRRRHDTTPQMAEGLQYTHTHTHIQTRARA